MDAIDVLVLDGDEDYIDLELTSSPSRILCSSPQSREFEFQMSTAATETETTTSPADELFYKGKLLPLYLPPRRQMLLNLLHHHPTTTTTTFEDTFYSLPSTTISPSESCRVSCDLNSDDFFFEWSNELNAFTSNHPTKITWTKKLKHSIFGHKLKASKEYLKSLFIRSACSHDTSTKPTWDKLPGHPSIATIIHNNNTQRRSFSSAIKRHSPTKCLSSSSSNSSSASSSFSSNSNANFHDLHCLRRSSSATEIERSIEGAIAHCKMSQ